jgi:RNA polymerase sigma-70 factor (ECF subfamily)
VLDRELSVALMNPRAMSHEAALDDELVARMCRGDRAAFGAIYKRHAPRLLALVRQIVGDPAEAEDVLHDAFLEAWRRASDYSPERGSVAAWLTVRARSRALDRRRAPARRDMALASSGIEDVVLGEAERHTAAHLAEQARLRSALAAMAPEERQVLVLGYFAGLSSREIADEVCIPVGTVKSRVRSALVKLRAWFATGDSAA